MEVSYTANWRDKGSVTFRVDVPDYLKGHYRRHYDAKSPEINVSRKKDMTQMAAEIHRRLIPMVEEDVCEAINLKQKSDEKADALVRRMAIFRRLCPTDTETGSDTLSFKVGEVEVEITFRYEQLDFSVQYVSDELALALVKAIREVV